MDTLTNDEQLLQIRRLLRICGLFLDLNGRMSMRALQAFLLIAQRPGQSVGDYARQGGLNTSTTSRLMADIGETDRWGHAGCGLIRSTPNPNNKREVEIYLTTRGEALLKQLLALMG